MSTEKEDPAPMRWFSRPENAALQLRVTPRPFSMNAKNDPDQVRLGKYLRDTTELVAASTIDDRPWALRLDVGAPRSRSLLAAVADLDNYSYPLAKELKNPHLVSVWATKQTDPAERSYIQIAAAVEVSPPTELVKLRTTGSWSRREPQDQIVRAVAGAQMLPDGPVRLELSFVIGNRTWLPLWKPTIDALDALLGRADPDRPYHPLDGRIVELGMHLTVDPALGYDVEIGIAPTPWYPGDRAPRRTVFGWRVTDHRSRQHRACTE